MEFLNNYGVSEVVIKDICDNNYDEVISNLICHEKEIGDTLLYLKEYGVETIDDLLLYHVDIFLLGRDKIETSFKRFRQEDVLRLVNEDSMNIDIFISGVL